MYSCNPVILGHTPLADAPPLPAQPADIAAPPYPANRRRPQPSNILGLIFFERVIVALRMLTYGVSADATNEYICIGESTASLRRFVTTAIDGGSDRSQDSGGRSREHHDSHQNKKTQNRARGVWE